METSRNDLPLAVRQHGEQRNASSATAPKGHRGISCYNPQIVSERVAVDVASRNAQGPKQQHDKSQAAKNVAGNNPSVGAENARGRGSLCTSFTLPNLTVLDRLFAETIWHDLVDSLTMETLQKRGKLFYFQLENSQMPEDFLVLQRK